MANLEENSPKVRCWDLFSIRPCVAMSQKAVEPPLPRIDLVALGEGEEVAHALADLADQVLDRGLAVGGAQQGGAGGGQRVERLRPHLGGAGAETSVGGLDVSGNLDISHGPERSPVGGQRVEEPCPSD